jgi:hypothetical protein
VEAKLNHENEADENGIFTESTFRMEGKEYHGVRDPVARVLLLDGRPELGDVWETDEGPYHVTGIRLPAREHDRYVVFMKQGRGDGVA